MSARRFAFFALAAVLLAPGASAGLTTFAESCARGNADSCQVAEVEARINFAQFDPKTGKYRLVFASSSPTNGDTAKQRAVNRAHNLCVLRESVWLGLDVAQYTRMTGVVAVDRASYGACMVTATANYLRDERKRQLFKALKIGAVAMASFLVFAALWYRRPIARKARHLMSRFNNLGAR